MVRSHARRRIAVVEDGKARRHPAVRQGVGGHVRPGGPGDTVDSRAKLSVPELAWTLGAFQRATPEPAVRPTLDLPPKSRSGFGIP